MRQLDIELEESSPIDVSFVDVLMVVYDINCVTVGAVDSFCRRFLRRGFFEII